MKTKWLFLFLIFAGSYQFAAAQHVRMRLNFPAGILLSAPSPAPFRGAVWIGPEWRWRGGTYVHVPGYWARPSRFGAVWIPGHWKYTRRGYRWVPGHWR